VRKWRMNLQLGLVSRKCQRFKTSDYMDAANISLYSSGVAMRGLVLWQ
jgi:hypothetical protein